jgi:alpha-mannosidase
MKLDDASIVLSCHSFDDFPVNHDGPEADSLLSAWTLLWHPAILIQTGKIPGWTRIDDLQSSLGCRLLTVPTVSWADLTEDLIARNIREGSELVRVDTSRQETLERVLAKIDHGSTAVDAEILADFFALGYCYLQIELLTRRMRYSSGVAQTGFQESLIAAAKAALAADVETARTNLRSCFDQLTQEREHYYAVEVYLLDIALVAEGLAPAKLQEQLAWSIPTSLMMSGHALRQLSSNHPAEIEAIRTAIQHKQVVVLGGEYHEHRLPLISSEEIRWQLATGLQAYQDVLGYRPTVFARRRYGLTPSLPQILKKFNFQGAIHATLDDGQFPQANQTKSRWEGRDGSSIDAIMRAPLDASRSATFLNLAGNLSDAMDMDHVATRCFVHWAGAANPWFSELRRIVRYTSALGKFVTADDYFRDTYSTSAHDRFTLSQYRSPYLKQAVDEGQRDPISSVVRDWQLTSAIDHLRRLSFLTCLLGVGEEGWQAELNDVILERLSANGRGDADLYRRIGDLNLRLARRVAEGLARSGNGCAIGTCLLNTAIYPVRVVAQARAVPNSTADRDPVYAVGNGDEVVADVPGMGFVWLPEPKQAATTSKARRRSPTIAVGNLLRNEFLEAEIDPNTGSLRFLRDYDSRGNRLAQQIALRTNSATVEDDAELQSARYSRMLADKVEIVRSDPLVGEIEAHGRLVDVRDDVVGEFSQRFRLERGSRVVRIHVTIDPRASLPPDPWNSYYGLRFTWADEAAELHVGVNDVRQLVTARRFESSLFIEIDDATHRTAILCGGIPFHTRTGRRSLDTPLIVAGETARSFQVGVGVDLKNTFRESLALLSPSIQSVPVEASDRPGSGWLFHVNARNVLATHWSLLDDVDFGPGFRARLVESEGKSTKVTLSTFRPVESARKVDFVGQTVDHCQTSDNQITFQMHENEWAQIEARFGQNKTG